MKKIVAIVLVTILAAIASIYIFIPSEIPVTKIAAVNATSAAGTRFLLNPEKWKEWWPSNDPGITSISKEVGFFYKGAHHTPAKELFNGYAINTIFKGTALKGEIIYAQLGSDSVAFFWKYQYTCSNNPIQRLQEYFMLKELKENTAEVLNSLKAFLENEEKVYGMKIKHSFVVDTILISTKAIFPSSPSIDQVYQMVYQLKKYVKQKNAKETGFPMVNVSILDKTHFQMMVALPVDRQLEETTLFSWKKMVAGKILIGEVKGGDARTKKAFAEMHNYVTDYQITSPAIPFISLVTDRKQEPDSSKWISRIYYPVL
ncbi:MAG: hypothetical protein WCH78_01195 [Bacteroidota bacterium]